MKFCTKCGSPHDDEAEICMNCGCRTRAKHTLTIKRESQFFLVNPAIKLLVTGENINQNFEIKDGQILPLELNEGKYNLSFSSGIRHASVDVELVKDSFIRLAWNRFDGKLEAWEISKI